MFNDIFATPVLRDSADLTPGELQAIARYLFSLAAQAPGDFRSNRGGWHSEGNLFSNEFPQLPALREAITSGLTNYIAEIFGYRGEIDLALTGWSVINHAGDYNVIHNHSANLLSGVLYVAVPEPMHGGAIVFQDPRLNLNTHFTDAMQSLGIHPPWLTPLFTIRPKAGELLVFPSWLNHYVEPFTHDDPDAARIVVSFNASVGAV